MEMRLQQVAMLDYQYHLHLPPLTKLFDPLSPRQEPPASHTPPHAALTREISRVTREVARVTHAVAPATQESMCVARACTSNQHQTFGVVHRSFAGRALITGLHEPENGERSNVQPDQSRSRYSCRRVSRVTSYIVRRLFGNSDFRKMSDSDVFSIKDPRPITAKFNCKADDRSRPRVYFSDSSDADVGQCLNLQVMGDEAEQSTNARGFHRALSEMKSSGEGSIATSSKKSKTRTRKEKGRKKGYKRINIGSSSTASIYSKPDLDKQAKAKADRLSKSENILKARKPKRKKKTPSNSVQSNIEYLSSALEHKTLVQSVAEDSPANLGGPILGRKASNYTCENPCESEQTARKKPNYERIAKLSERKGCNRGEHQHSWVNPMLSKMDTEPEKHDEHAVPEEEEASENQAPCRPTSPPGRPVVRYTNLSLSMPNTREGRRKEEEEATNSWLFECRNIWGTSCSGSHHNPNNYQYEREPYQGVDLSQGYRHRTPVVLQPSQPTRAQYSSHVTHTSQSEHRTPMVLQQPGKSNRFIHSMRNSPASRGVVMRTVKQGSFVLLGTVKTIRDDREKLNL